MAIKTRRRVTWSVINVARRCHGRSRIDGGLAGENGVKTWLGRLGGLEMRSLAGSSVAPEFIKTSRADHRSADVSLSFALSLSLSFSTVNLSRSQTPSRPIQGWGLVEKRHPSAARGTARRKLRSSMILRSPTAKLIAEKANFCWTSCRRWSRTFEEDCQDIFLNVLQYFVILVQSDMTFNWRKICVIRMKIQKSSF